jgi:hypothetical protein
LKKYYLVAYFNHWKTMAKRFSRLGCLLVAMSLCANAGAQSTCTHEFALSYGLGSTSGFVAVSASVIAAIFGATIDYSFIGPVAGEYFYHVSELVGVGGVVSYAAFKDKKTPGNEPMNCIALLPGVKLDWLRREQFGMYSKLCAGAACLTSPGESTDTEERSGPSGSLFFNFQASLLGVEFGGGVRGFVEAGVGEQGFLLAGARFRF